MVVLKPEINEILQGQVITSNKRGLFVLVGLAIVFIPEVKMMKPSY